MGVPLNLSPFKALETWLSEPPTIPGVQPAVAATAFLYLSVVQPELPPAGSGEPNMAGTTTSNVGTQATFYGNAVLSSPPDPPGLVVTTLLDDPVLPFGSIVFSTAVQWEQEGFTGNVTLPGLAAGTAFTYMPSYPPSDYRGLAGAQVDGPVTFSVSASGSFLWLEFQLTAGVNDGEMVTPYWVAVFLQQSASYRGPAGQSPIPVHRLP